MTTRKTVEELLTSARSTLRRRGPHEARTALADGALLVDIRSDSQRALDGVVPGGLFIPRNVLEWRCDPTSPWREPLVAEGQGEVIVMCDEGYQSSLAAATLAELLGPDRVSDLIGGFQAWRAAGLPVEPHDGGAIGQSGA